MKLLKKFLNLNRLTSILESDYAYNFFKIILWISFPFICYFIYYNIIYKEQCLSEDYLYVKTIIVNESTYGKGTPQYEYNYVIDNNIYIGGVSKYNSHYYYKIGDTLVAKYCKNEKAFSIIDFEHEYMQKYRKY